MDVIEGLIGPTGGEISALQMSLRAILIFVIGVTMVRLAATRAFGKWGAFDIIVAVMVGSSLASAMTGGVPFVPTLTATAVLVLLHELVSRGSARWTWLGRLTKGPSVPLVVDGVADEHTMRKVGIGPGDLRMAARTAGHTDLATVRSARLERNGDITIISS